MNIRLVIGYKGTNFLLDFELYNIIIQ